jgi:hypothetical protein
MKCEKDSTEVYPGQDPATANDYLGQHAVWYATDNAVMKYRRTRLRGTELSTGLLSPKPRNSAGG